MDRLPLSIIENWFRSWCQHFGRRVHFRSLLWVAKYKSSNAASSLGKCAIAFVTLRGEKFNDSMAFVLQTGRTSFACDFWLSEGVTPTGLSFELYPH